MSIDVMNLNDIYNPAFSFSLPRAVLESYIDGTAFGGKKIYTGEDKVNLKLDISDWLNEINSHQLQIPKDKIAVLTAGAPGAGKTKLMKEKLDFEESQGRYVPYLDPDDAFLKTEAKRTYLTQKAEKGSTYEDQLKAYEDWRAASNAATQIVLARLIKNDSPFYYGTTSTGDKTWIFLNFLKLRGYSIKILHISAPDNVREESVALRNQEFVQVVDADVKGKGILLPQRIQDTYLKYAKEIEFYFRGGAKERPVLAATWIRNPEGTETLGNLHIQDQKMFDEILKVHRAQCEFITKGADPDFWERSLMQASKIVP